MKTSDAAILRLLAIIESSDDAIISHALDGTIETWNRSAERIFGYAAAEALGCPIDLIVPVDRRAEDQQLQMRVRSGEAVDHFDTFGCAKGNTLIPISLAISAVLAPDGQMLGISRIVRDMSQTRALQREAFRLAAIVDSSDDAIVSKNLDGIVQTWNKAAERMFGYTQEEIVGRSITLIIPPERLSEETEVLSRIRSGRSVDHFETVRRRKDGTLLDISLTVSPIRTPDGAIIGASKIARDITLQRQLARAAEDASRSKDEFLAMLSHELRTPLNAVLGYTRMLRMGHFEEERRDKMIEIIERNAKILSQLVADVLDVSSIVTGKIRVRAEPCDLVPVLAAALDSVRPSAEAKSVALDVKMPAAPLPARCDADRLQQVFWNLLSNAVKFTPRGGRVCVALERRDGLAHIVVSDTGIGIRPEALPYVFQRFWQGESGQTRQTGGLGLGLALARHFVELHGGTIKAESAGEGKGASFTVALPLSDEQSGA